MLVKKHLGLKIDMWVHNDFFIVLHTVLAMLTELVFHNRDFAALIYDVALLQQFGKSFWLILIRDS